MNGTYPEQFGFGALRCSVDAVKSLTARATTALREGIRGEDA